MIKDRNGKDLAEADEIKTRWQECTEEVYKKYLNDPDNHYGLVTYLELDILECKVKWTLGSIMNKASGGDGIPAELFQILKDDTVKMLHSVWQQVWKTQYWPQDCGRWVIILGPKKDNAKNVQTTIRLFISHASTIMLQILHVRLQQNMGWELPDVQAGFTKGRGTRG